MYFRLSVILLFLLPAVAQAQITGLGVFGASLDDEYFENSGAYAKNWVELTALYRGVNYGPTAVAAGQPGGTWGEPRRTGYSLNWARSGATASSMLGYVNANAGAITSQITGGQMTHAVVEIGANDYSPGGTAWTNIYNNTWTPTQIANQRAAVVANVTNIVNTLQSQGVKVVLSGLPDFSICPSVRSNPSSSDASKRQLVSSALNAVNNDLKAYCQAHQIPFADIKGMSEQFTGTNLAPLTNVTIGGNVLSSSSFGVPPNNLFVADGVHPHTLTQGYLGNLFLEALNQGYQTGIPLFTEQEIVVNAGLTFTGNTFNFDASQFVTNFAAVPEPATLALVGLAVGGGAGGYFWRCRQRRKALEQSVE